MSILSSWKHEDFMELASSQSCVQTQTTSIDLNGIREKCVCGVLPQNLVHSTHYSRGHDLPQNLVQSAQYSQGHVLPQNMVQSTQYSQGHVLPQDLVQSAQCSKDQQQKVILV
ncbi:hypothetical protein ElyMa_001279100 [Elysia marginata]|uniref:Uncharacterized protein n=1 Tax=Elysia marginata TaxID=1093978 RepID=A0AAV4IJR1_9GAST|nr:hypothetical protein ElyMa_001279100 [Elysia marginata]